MKSSKLARRTPRARLLKVCAKYFMSHSEDYHVQKNGDEWFAENKIKIRSGGNQKK